MLLSWSSSQGLNALVNSAEFIAGFADKGSGEVDLTLAKGTGSATFTRATTATTVNSAGLIVSVASGTPRSYYDPTTLGYMGYLAEGARTNLCLQSNAFTTSPWVASSGSNAQNETGPDGVSNSAWTCPGLGTQSVLQDATLTAANYTFSVFVKKTTGVSGAFPVLRLYSSAAGSLTGLCTIDTNNGIVTAWTSLLGGWTIQTTSVSISSFGNFWKVALTVLTTAHVWTAAIYPVGATTSTQSSGTITGANASNVFWGAQLEAGSFASSYIPTTTASVPRNADVLTYPTSGNALGTTGSAYAEVSTFWTAAQQGSGTPRILDIATNRPPLYWRPTNELCIYDGTAESLGVPFLEGSTLQKVASCWGGSTMLTASAGSVSSSAAFDGNMDVGVNMFIGSNGSSTAQWFGTIRNVRIYQTQLSSAQLQAVTA